LFLKRALFGLSLIALPLNMREGLYYAKAYDTGMKGLEAEIRAGVPPKLLAEHHAGFLQMPEDVVARGLRQLQTHRIGIGKRIAADPPSERSIRLALARGDQKGEWYEAAIDAPTPSLSARFVFVGPGLKDALPQIQVEWLPVGQNAWEGGNRFVYVTRIGDSPRWRCAVWIGQPITRIRVRERRPPRAVEFSDVNVTVGVRNGNGQATIAEE
jgi:hypothetical protein